MGRLGLMRFVVLAFMLFLLALSVTACGGGSATNSLPDEVPATISLSPATNSSMDVGATQTFTATAHNRNNSTINEVFAYQSSNPAVVSVANTGAVCAGTWDSLVAPTTCTPGAVGTSEVMATAKGVSSPPTLVYVHEHITSIQISVVPALTNPPADQPCYSKGQTLAFQATAYNGVGNNLIDITSSVGQFSWQAAAGSVAGLVPISRNSSNQIILNQTQATAGTPGTTYLYATVDGVNSAPYNFVTCAVKSIALYVPGTSSTSFVVPTGSSTTIYATVLDTLGKTVTGVPLTWNSSNHSAVTVSGSVSALYGSVGQTASPAVGASAITASCTPPTCNIGFSPTLPIYPSGVINFIVAGNSTTAADYSIYVTSKGTGVDPTTNQPWSCGTISGCEVRIIPINGASTGVNTIGTAGVLNSAPNSLIFDSAGTTAFLGVDSGQLGTRGLMVVTASNNSLTQQTAAPGKVLAVSPDGFTVIVSDIVDTPNQVYVFDTSTSTVAATLNITGATAAAFSPDNLKAFIVAGSTLYIYSGLDALQTVQLTPAGLIADDVAFLPVGAFALISGNPQDVTAYTTCTGAVAVDGADTPQIVTTPGIPSMLRPLPDGTHVLAMDSPGIDYLNVNPTSTGCPPTISSALGGSVNLGQGGFVPTQFIISPDGLTAYILTQNSGVVLVLSIANKTTSAIALTGNATALQAALTPDGRFLYVGAEDVPPPVTPDSPPALGSIHVLDTVSGADVQQIIFPQLSQVPQPFCIGAGNPPLPPPSPVTYCYPDLIAVKP
jgi:hypothetical protein